MIYLDNSATTYPKPECVYKALDYANRNLAFNAGRGTYEQSIKALEIIEEARRAVASLVNAKSSEVSFFSSATESLNIIINGLPIEEGDTVYISPFEHNAIVRPLYALKESVNFEIKILPFDKQTWEPDLVKMKEMFSLRKPKAVFVSQISNVTGLMIDYESIFELSKQCRAFTILDSAQSFGVINPNLKNVDFCVFAGHKSLYASFGIAGFIAKDTSCLKITKSGGNGSDSLNHKMPEKGHERVESGSPNVIAAYGLIESINWLKDNDVYKHEKDLTQYLVNNLRKIESAIIYVPASSEHMCGIVSFNVEGFDSNDVSAILAEEFNICVRAGYHCSPYVHEFIDSTKFKGTVRVSVGAFNTKDDIDALITAIKTL